MWTGRAQSSREPLQGGGCPRPFLMQEQRELLLAPQVPFCSGRQEEGSEWGLLEGSI